MHEGGIPATFPGSPVRWRALTASHLSCHHASSQCPTCKSKLHGVFPSDRGQPASSQVLRLPSSLQLRQRPNRYAFRAGRNLPDKEFRYLRTVIVTAAVYWGFGSSASLALTAPLDLPAPGRRHPYTSACAFAKLCFW